MLFEALAIFAVAVGALHLAPAATLHVVHISSNALGAVTMTVLEGVNILSQTLSPSAFAVPPFGVSAIYVALFACIAVNACMCFGLVSSVCAPRQGGPLLSASERRSLAGGTKTPQNSTH